MNESTDWPQIYNGMFTCVTNRLIGWIDWLINGINLINGMRYELAYLSYPIQTSLCRHGRRLIYSWSNQSYTNLIGGALMYLFIDQSACEPGDSIMLTDASSSNRLINEVPASLEIPAERVDGTDSPAGLN